MEIVENQQKIQNSVRRDVVLLLQTNFSQEEKEKYGFVLLVEKNVDNGENIVAKIVSPD